MKIIDTDVVMFPIDGRIGHSSHFRAEYPRNLVKMQHFCTFATEFGLKRIRYLIKNEHTDFFRKPT